MVPISRVVTCILVEEEEWMAAIPEEQTSDQRTQKVSRDLQRYCTETDTGARIAPYGSTYKR
jgi:hypothetical protein